MHSPLRSKIKKMFRYLLITRPPTKRAEKEIYNPAVALFADIYSKNIRGQFFYLIEHLQEQGRLLQRIIICAIREKSLLTVIHVVKQ